MYRLLDIFTLRLFPRASRCSFPVICATDFT